METKNGFSEGALGLIYGAIAWFLYEPITACTKQALKADVRAERDILVDVSLTVVHK